MPDLPAAIILKTELQIAKIQKAVSMWEEAGLPEHTIIILLQHKTKVPKGTIKKILIGIDSLYEDYFKIEEQ